MLLCVCTCVSPGTAGRVIHGVPQTPAGSEKHSCASEERPRDNYVEIRTLYLTVQMGVAVVTLGLLPKVSPASLEEAATLCSLSSEVK